MNQKPLLLAITLIALLVIAGAFWYLQNRPPMTVNQPVVKEAPIQAEQPTQTEGTEGIKDLIDGEYAFTPVDTSDWQTYRNEEVGFEVKIPKDWFCGGIALDPNSKRSVACLEKIQKEAYYAGRLKNKIVITVNLSDNDGLNIGELREVLELDKMEKSKIYRSTVDEQSVVIVIDKYNVGYISNIPQSWYISSSIGVKRDVLNGFLLSFRTLK
ncbi:MAG: hypothetical protein IPJ68_02900 [Candidatus Moraniibacteriota bacterium]|nr:MAG: hypothetical protein IPJ68_02900 [Candidatus Moranbacteria bacterium]